jgi:hypothetical protein
MMRVGGALGRLLLCPLLPAAAAALVDGPPPAPPLAALQYLGELMTETHMASPQGWEAARSGRAEDLSLIAAAAAR